jgi:hypothetical protein
MRSLPVLREFYGKGNDYGIAVNPGIVKKSPDFPVHDAL